MDVLRQDLRAAIAAMRRAPAVSSTAVITLALGIGATLTVFATLHGVLLRPLPYANPGELVRVWEQRPGGTSPTGNRWLSRGAFGVTPLDPLAFVAAPFGLAVTSVLACLGPALRAAAADPVVTLRK
jgi:hypothetical protein